MAAPIPITRRKKLTETGKYSHFFPVLIHIVLPCFRLIFLIYSPTSLKNFKYSKFIKDTEEFNTGH